MYVINLDIKFENITGSVLCCILTAISNFQNTCSISFGHWPQPQWTEL